MNEEYGICRLSYAKSTLPQNMVFENGDERKVLPIDFAIFLLQSENRKILIDAGCDTMPGFIMEDFISPKTALEKIGIRAEEITDVIITHAHHDHIDAVHLFKNATVYIEEDEYLQGKRYIPAQMSVRTFSKRLQLSENLYIETIGGHSQGSSVVHLLQDGRHYVFAGDECYSAECLRTKTPTGSSVDPIKSREFTDKFCADTYTVLLAHDKNEIEV